MSSLSLIVSLHRDCSYVIKFLPNCQNYERLESKKTAKKHKNTLKPISVIIMSNFICETVYYVVRCILFSADNYRSFKKIDDTDYTEYIVHTLRLEGKEMVHSSEVYSSEVKKTEILMENFRRAIGLRIKENKEVCDEISVLMLWF